MWKQKIEHHCSRKQTKSTKRKVETAGHGHIEGDVWFVLKYRQGFIRSIALGKHSRQRGRHEIDSVATVTAWFLSKARREIGQEMAEGL